MKQLTIYRRLFSDSDCFRAGVRQTPVGVQIHSTGANNPWLRRYVQPDDGRLGSNRYGNHSNQPGSSVCASAYIGRLADGQAAVYQTLPWDMRCWLSGSGVAGNANRLGYIGFEICEDDGTDRAYFEQVMELAVLLTAHLCSVIGTAPDRVLGLRQGCERLAVMDHAELHACGVASGHADIGHWLRRFGWSMDDFRSGVCAALAEGVAAVYIDCDAEAALQGTCRISANGYVNCRVGPSMDERSVAQLRPGSLVEAAPCSEPGWSEVILRGYIRNEYLTRGEA